MRVSFRFLYISEFHENQTHVQKFQWCAQTILLSSLNDLIPLYAWKVQMILDFYKFYSKFQNVKRMSVGF